MKRILWLVPLLIATTFGRSFAAAPVADVFREGLFAEEATRDLPAAIQAYEEVVRRLDEQRRLAATAVFRLGECHRKLGQTNEAATAFERVLREFPGEETLVKLSRENLTLLRPREIPAPLAQPHRDAADSEAMTVASRIATLSAQLATITNAPNSELMVEAALAVTSDARLGELLSGQLRLEQELAAKQVNYSDEHPEVHALMQRLKTVSEEIDGRVSTLRRVQELQIGALKRAQETLPAAARDQQRALLGEEIALLQEALQNQRLLVEAGRAEATTVLSMERELLALERQMAAVRETLGLAAGGDSGPAPATSEEAEEIRRIQTLVANSPDLINAPSEDKLTPLAAAAKKGQLVVARYLLDHGARVNDTSSQPGYTPLHFAVEAGHRTMAELLIERGATVAPRISDTPLRAAAEMGFVSLAELLISKGADVNFQADFAATKFVTPLWWAVTRDRQPMVEFLLKHGADPNLAGAYSRDSRPSTPLTEARSSSMIQVLLDHGADPNADNSACLMEAVDVLAIERLSQLLAGGAKVNIQASVSARRDDGYRRAAAQEAMLTPLSLAASKGWLEGARLLHEHGADLNLPDAGGQGLTPLHRAVAAQHLEMVRWLLAEGAKVDARDSESRTPLAIVFNQVPNALLHRGAGYGRVAVATGPTRAALPSRYGEEREPAPADVWDIVIALLTGGADPAVTWHGFALIHYAAAAGRIDVFEALKEHGANLDARGEGMVTPLMVAVGMDQADALDWLLRNGADVDLQNEDSNTALHFAAWKQSPSLAKRLLEAGASRTEINVMGKTPAGFTERLAPVSGTSFGLPRLLPGRLGGLPGMGELPVMQPGNMVFSQNAELKRLLMPPEPAPTAESPSQP